MSKEFYDYWKPEKAREILRSWAEMKYQFFEENNIESYGVNREWMRLIIAVSRGEGFIPTDSNEQEIPK